MPEKAQRWATPCRAPTSRAGRERGAASPEDHRASGAALTPKRKPGGRQEAARREPSASAGRSLRATRQAARARRTRAGGQAARALMRIVGGRLRGRALAAPKSPAIRPTADRLRESLFNILVHAYGDPVTDARVLDLFAGTGALGLEALSRGAGFALLVDDAAPSARALMRDNVAALGLGGTARIFRRDATTLGEVHPLEPFSLAFLDPPYGHGLGRSARLLSRAPAAGSRPRRWSWSRRRPTPASRRPRASRSSSAAATTTRS